MFMLVFADASFPGPGHLPLTGRVVFVDHHKVHCLALQRPQQERP